MLISIVFIYIYMKECNLFSTLYSIDSYIIMGNSVQAGYNFRYISIQEEGIEEDSVEHHRGNRFKRT